MKRYKRYFKEEQSLIKIKGNYYHQTSKYAVKSILDNGFYVESGGNQRLTDGVYFLDHAEGDFGDATL
jgi:hypothetical protein